MSIDNNKRFLFFLLLLPSFLPSFFRGGMDFLPEIFAPKERRTPGLIPSASVTVKDPFEYEGGRGEEQEERRSVNIHGRVSNDMKIETTSPPLVSSRKRSLPLPPSSVQITCLRSIFDSKSRESKVLKLKLENSSPSLPPLLFPREIFFFSKNSF